MNRSQRRQLARKYGWRGAKAKRGMSFDDALAVGVREEEQAEHAAYVAKIQEAARRTREMGLVIPGQ